MRHSRSWASPWRDLRFLCISNIIAYDKHYVDVEFLGQIGDQEPRLSEPDSFTESGWFPWTTCPSRSSRQYDTRSTASRAAGTIIPDDRTEKIKGDCLSVVTGGSKPTERGCYENS